MSTSLTFSRQKSDNFQPQGLKKSLTVLTDPGWKEMTDHQELLLMILDIREELISNVYKEYAEKNREKQSAKFIVNCMQDAWKKIFNLNFLPHNFLNLNNKSFWLPDTEPVLCKPDSWSKTNLKINMKNYPKEAIQQTKEDDDYILENVPYPTFDAYESPSAEFEPRIELEDRVHNSLISLTDSLPKHKLLSSITVQFSEQTVGSTLNAIDSSHDYSANKSSECNTFYRMMRMPRQSLPSLIATSRTPQKMKMHPWHLEDEIHDDFRKPYALIPALRFNATTTTMKRPTLRDSARDRPSDKSNSTGSASRKLSRQRSIKRTFSAVQFSALPDEEDDI